MIPTPKTWFLLVIAVLVGVANLIPGGTRAVPVLPVLPAVAINDVTRIEITQGASPKIALQLDDEGEWQIVSPWKAAADTPGIRRLIRLFDDPVPMDARIDEDNPDPYGLEYQDAAAVDIYTGGEVATIAFVIGWDTSGGSSFVRFHEDDVVYRAKIGGRARWDKDVDDWRDPFVVREAKASLTDIVVDLDGERFSFASDGGVTGGAQRTWSLVEDPDFSLDTRAVEAWASSLVAIRAGEVLSAEFDGGFDEPVAVITLQFDDGGSIELVWGSREAERSAFVKRSDRDTVYRVSSLHRTRVLRPLADYGNALVLSFDREQVKTVTLEDEGIRGVLQQGDPGDWVMREPANVDLDLKLVYFTVNNLGDLRADAFVDTTLADAGLLDPWMSVTVKLLDGTKHRLDVGALVSEDPRNPRFHARVTGTERVFLIREQTVTRIRQGFGRSG